MTANSLRHSPVMWWTMIAAAITVTVAGVGFLAVRGTPTPAGYSPQIEDWDLPGIDGTGHIRLADFRGHPVVVNFFASWCVACDAELPGFAAASQQLRGQVSFVGVNALETGDPLSMPRRHGITWWPLARDIGDHNNNLHNMLSGGLDAMPITAWYDKDGRLLHVDRGALPETALHQRLAELYEIILPGPATP